MFQSVFGYLHSQQSEALSASLSPPPGPSPSSSQGAQDSLHRVSSVSCLGQGTDSVAVRERCSSSTDRLEFDVLVGGNGHRESVTSSCLASAFVVAPSSSSSSSANPNSYVAILLECAGVDKRTRHYVASFPTSVLQTIVSGGSYPKAPHQTHSLPKICFYSRGVEASKSFSLLLCAPITEAAEDCYFLFRLELSGGLFTEVHTSSTSTSTATDKALGFRDIQTADLTKIASLETLSSRIRFRRLDSLPYRLEDGDMGLLQAQGERGVAIVCDAKNRVLILDLETDEDDEEEDDDDDGDKGDLSISLDK